MVLNRLLKSGTSPLSPIISIFIGIFVNDLLLLGLDIAKIGYMKKQRPSEKFLCEHAES